MRIEQGITENERLKVIEWAFSYFKDVANKNYFYGLLLQETNWNLSVKLVDNNDEIKGLYLFGDKQLSSLVQGTEYDRLKGIEGVLLAVDKSIRGQGWGNKLKDYTSTLGFDYIWGQQLKKLNNLSDWLKRRVLIAELNNCYITLEIFVEKKLQD